VLCANCAKAFSPPKLTNSNSCKIPMISLYRRFLSHCRELGSAHDLTFFCRSVRNRQLLLFFLIFARNELLPASKAIVRRKTRMINTQYFKRMAGS
jgi:hypothetical protein